MAEELLKELIDVFNHINFRFLTVADITLLLQKRGLYQDVKFSKAETDVWEMLCSHPVVFCDIERNGELFWGLERWLPPKHRRFIRSQIRVIEPAHIGLEIQHIISTSYSELINGTLPLRGNNSSNLIASMDEKQRNNLIIELCCYGCEKIMCAIAHDENGDWFLEGMALKRWYRENDLQPGDKIWLVIENIQPLTLRIYTEWDRDADTYRRYEQRRNLQTIPFTDLPIRDLIWIYFLRTQKVSHRLEISNSILADRPEISERSVDVCLGAYPHLFVRVGQGNWALKEWEVEQVTMLIRPKSSNPGMSTDGNIPTVIVPLDYVLANIAAEDLVFKILQSSRSSLSDSQITERIANYLGVDRRILSRTSFLNPMDNRLIRCQDGTFILREYFKTDGNGLETEKLEQLDFQNLINEKQDELNDNFRSTTIQCETQIENEQDNAPNLDQSQLQIHVEHTPNIQKERNLFSRLLTKLIAIINSYFDRFNMQLSSNCLHRKAKRPRTKEEEQS